MKILVTGGSGCIGSNFIHYLQKNFSEYSVINLDAELLGSNRKHLSQFENSLNYKFVLGNINDKKLVDDFNYNQDYNWFILKGYRVIKINR